MQKSQGVQSGGGGCVPRIEVIVKMKKKSRGGGGPGGGRGVGWVDVNQELKYL